MKKFFIKTKMNNDRGIATVESALLLSIFIVFMTYCVGTFGVIHSGILNSISARSYAFETFRNRSNLNYFRDIPGLPPEQTKKYGMRLHGISTERATDADQAWFVTERTMSMGRDVASGRTPDTGEAFDDKKRETKNATPVYLKTAYGICLNYKCGGT